MQDITPLADQALRLGPEERAELIEMLLASFDTAERKELDAAWAAEAEARLDAHLAGDLADAPATEVLARLRRR